MHASHLLLEEFAQYPSGQLIGLTQVVEIGFIYGKSALQLHWFDKLSNVEPEGQEETQPEWSGIE